MRGDGARRWDASMDASCRKWGSLQLPPGLQGSRALAKKRDLERAEGHVVLKKVPRYRWPPRPSTRAPEHLGQGCRRRPVSLLLLCPLYIGTWVVVTAARHYRWQSDLGSDVANKPRDGGHNGRLPPPASRGPPSNCDNVVGSTPA